MNHTPYKLSETCDHRPAIMDANGHNIVSWDPATIELFGDPRSAIITACNAHEELVAALRGLVCELESVNVPAPGLIHARKILATLEKGA